MQKPVIVIADSDKKITDALELKFLESLDEQIDIEIITEKDYFNSYFTFSKTIEILAVSDEFYNAKLAKHNIGHVFILSENASSDISDKNTDVIFKYSNINDIYSYIIAKSNFNPEKRKRVNTLVTLVYSASGGVGKTSVALGICKSLANIYNKVLYINAQRLNSFQCYLNNDAAIPSSVITEFLNPDISLFNRISYIIRNESFDYLPPFPMSLESLGLNYSIYLNLIKSAVAQKKYDAIIVDADVAFDKEITDLIEAADKVLIVLNQDKPSVYATNMLIKNINCSDNGKYYFICNKFKDEKHNALLDKSNACNFIVNEYVHHMNCDLSTQLPDLSKSIDIQKISFLLN